MSYNEPETGQTSSRESQAGACLLRAMFPIEIEVKSACQFRRPGSRFWVYSQEPQEGRRGVKRGRGATPHYENYMETDVGN